MAAVDGVSARNFLLGVMSGDGNAHLSWPWLRLVSMSFGVGNWWWCRREKLPLAGEISGLVGKRVAPPAGKV